MMTATPRSADREDTLDEPRIRELQVDAYAGRQRVHLQRVGWRPGVGFLAVAVEEVPVKRLDAVEQRVLRGAAVAGGPADEDQLLAVDAIGAMLQAAVGTV